MFGLFKKHLLPRMRRVTSGGTYQPELDGVRFLAIILVLIQHTHERAVRHAAEIYPGVSERVLAIGVPGVAIFFALSGLILYRGLKSSLAHRERIDLRTYFWRRITRLEPPYLIVMTGILFALLLTGYEGGRAARAMRTGPDNLFVAWLASVTYSYGLIFDLPPKLNVVAWSLEIEVQFYLLAPLIAYLAFQLPYRLRLAALFAFAIGWAVCFSSWAVSTPHLRRSIALYMPVFFMGILVEELSTLNGNEKQFGRAGLIGDLVAAVALGWLLFVPISDPKSLILVRSICVIGILWGSLQGKWLRAILSNAWVSAIGGMCYSIYLIHLAIIEVGMNFTYRVGLGLPYPIYFMIQMSLMILLVAPAALVFYMLAERPCMEKNWPQKLDAWFKHKLYSQEAPQVVSVSSIDTDPIKIDSE